MKQKIVIVASELDLASKNIGRKILELGKFKRVADIALERQNLKDFIDDEEDHRPDAGLDDIYAEIDKLEIEINYMMMVAVEEVILGNTARAQPRVIFIGQAHADQFFGRREELRQKYGITLDEYWRHEITSEPKVDLGMALKMDDVGIDIESLMQPETVSTIRLVDPSETLYEDPEVFTTKRLYRSVKGNSITNGSPDFIGNWFVPGYNLGKPHRGLFEVYISKPYTKTHGNGTRKILGKIEDCFGTATFYGEISPRGISFTKIYDTSRYGGCDTPLKYEGVFTNGIYQGDFVARNDRTKTFGTFTMKATK